jgi:hypothetical protein
MLTVGAGTATPHASGTPGPTGPPPTPPPVVPPPPAGTTYRDFKYETEVVTSPTATKAQSKLWFAAGAWWAGLHQPFTNQLNIFRLDWETQRWIDTGTLVDERPFADPDFVWTGTHLYVVSAGHTTSERHAGRVLRFSLDEDDQRFELDPNFPVPVFPTGASAAVIAVDTTGTVWVAYAAASRIWVAHSLEHDAHWSQPFELPVTGTTVALEDIASIVAFGPGRIGVMWSNQLADSVFFSVHVDGDPPGTWSPPETVVDGLGSSDDHINLKAFPDAVGGTGVVAALKTSLDDATNVNPLSPLILLVVRAGNGTWTSNLVSQVRDKQTRAVVMVDETARMFYVAATAPSGGGSIVYKRTPIDAVAFESGGGQPLVASPQDVRISNASSTKQSLTAESGLVVLASDDESGRYLHAVVDLGDGLPPADPADPTRPERPDPPDPPSPITLIADDFEPWAVGKAEGTGWLPRPTDPSDAVSIADDGADGRALRVVPAGDGLSVRACRALPRRPPGTLSVQLRVRIGALGTSDTSILSMRGSGGEAASVRVTTRGEFAWYDRLTKVRSTAAFKAGTWYRLQVRVDSTAKTYAFTIATDGGDALVERTSVRWRHAEVPSVQDVCFETATGNSKQRIDISEVQVLEEPAE